MELFKNLIYECKKGMRDLALYTCSVDDVDMYRGFLEITKTPYHIEELENNKINIFMGNPKCLEILSKFSNNDLSKITPEEDFILGIMLGYSREEQYSRILSRFSV